MSLIDQIRHVLGAPHPHPAELLNGDFFDADSDGAQVVPAAVLMTIIARPRPTFLLTRRTTTLRRHAGQVSFPGGRIDPEDKGEISAALREAQEEIGLSPDHVDVIGVLEPYRTVTGFHITPVVGVIPPDLPLVPHAAEVALVFEAPLDVMLEPANHIQQAVEWQGRDRHYYEISWDGERIWGATAAMIVNLGRRLAYDR
jgi:8-oxo-dGTP pyrophosphatase MutT (NUDIX family)